MNINDCMQLGKYLLGHYLGSGVVLDRMGMLGCHELIDFQTPCKNLEPVYHIQLRMLYLSIYLSCVTDIFFFLLVSALRIVPRIDKRKDRVEISDEQMIKTTQVAEELAKRLKKPNLRVVGWYHSHPNITVWPSHVDLRTQFNYQMLDKDFIGLIFR